MEDTQIVDVLDVTLAEIETEMESLGQKMKSIQGLCLRFRDGWNVRRSR